MNYRDAEQAFAEQQKDGSFPAVVYQATIGRDTIYTPQQDAAFDFADITGRRADTAGLERQIVTIRRKGSN